MKKLLSCLLIASLFSIGCGFDGLSEKSQSAQNAFEQKNQITLSTGSFRNGVANLYSMQQSTVNDQPGFQRQGQYLNITVSARLQDAGVKKATVKFLSSVDCRNDAGQIQQQQVSETTQIINYKKSFRKVERQVQLSFGRSFFLPNLTSYYKKVRQLRVVGYMDALKRAASVCGHGKFVRMSSTISVQVVNDLDEVIDKGFPHFIIRSFPRTQFASNLGVFCPSSRGCVAR